MKIWVDDQLIERSSKQVDENNWPHGTGLFETVRTENGSPHLLSRHMRRALASGRALAIPIPEQELIMNAVDMLMNAEPQQIGRLRLCFSTNGFIATHESYATEVRDYKIALALRARQTTERQHKLFPYDSRLSLLQSAREIGCDELVLTDPNGLVSEGAVSNYAFRINGQWRTPPITAGILPGVIRAIAIEKCGVVVRDLSRTDVKSCQAAIAISSLKIAVAVSSIDGQTLTIDTDVLDICTKLRQLSAPL